MSDAVRRRRRRRRHTSAIRRTPEQLRQQQHRRWQISIQELLACGGVGLICVLLIALIWITTNRAIGYQADDTRARAEAALSAQAATLTILVQHELEMIDQSLALLQAAWDNGQNGINLTEWQARLPALTSVTDDLFICNERHVIVQDIIPAAIGQGIGSAYANFATGSLEPIQTDVRGRDTAMITGELGDSGVVRQFLMYLIRPLGRPPGWLIGASYRSKALTDVFAAGGLGRQGLAALIDTRRGGVQSVAGLAAVRPHPSVDGSPMYKAMVARPDGGIWIGPTALDGVDRILAFRHVPGRDLFVLVGAATSDAMAPAADWAEGAESVAAAATLLVIAIGATVLWELWHSRRNRHRQRASSQTQDLLNAAQTELAGLRLKSALDAAHLRAILAGVSEGVAVFDGDHRLTAWNPRFAALCGVPADELHSGLLLEDLLRRQTEAGQFGELTDAQAEVDRRLALLRPDTGVAEIAEIAPDGTPRELRAELTREGGLVLVLRGAVTASVPQPVAAVDIDAAATADPAGAGPVEW